MSNRPVLCAFIFLAIASLSSVTIYQFERLYANNVRLTERNQNLMMQNELLIGQLDSFEKQYLELSVRLKLQQSQYTAPTRINLKRPTLGELTTFLAQDPTSNQAYQFGTGIHLTVGDEDFNVGYVCSNYASDLKRRAATAGLNISLVIIDYEATKDTGAYIATGHILNGVILSDGRWLWIEPQTDTVSSSLKTLMKIGFKLSSIEILKLAITW